MSRARWLRKNMTNAERVLWRGLRSRQLAGHKFRRQEPIGRFIVDFICFEKRLVVELDGGQHAEESQASYDSERTAGLKQNGFCVLRFWDHEVLQQLESVLEDIARAINLTSSPSTGED
jgi:very-short-patch-repair endonuclease